MTEKEVSILTVEIGQKKATGGLVVPVKKAKLYEILTPEEIEKAIKAKQQELKASTEAKPEEQTE